MPRAHIHAIALVLLLAGCSDASPPKDAGPTCDLQAVDCEASECASICDADQDGYLTADHGGDDCDDYRAWVYPNAPEVCDTLDNDCDGLVDDDDEDALTEDLPWHPDTDGDGYGAEGQVVYLCESPHPDAVGIGGDCNDNDPSVNPGEEEFCNGIDNDCNGLVDDGLLYVDWYLDLDGDGYGKSPFPVNSCEVLSGFVDNNDDCDDLNADVNPTGLEVCNGLDDNCDGALDADDPTLDLTTIGTWYPDVDGDQLGDGGYSVEACLSPAGYADNGEDCDDGDPAVGAPFEWYTDLDADGFGRGPPLFNCGDPGVDYIQDIDGDCNDNDAAFNPSQYDICEDGLDQDCSGADCVTCTGVRIGWLLGWGSAPDHASLIWDDLLAEAASLGECSIELIAINPGFTLNDLTSQGVTVLWTGNAAGDGIQYTPGEQQAIADFLSGGHGGLVSSHYKAYVGSDNGFLADLTGIDSQYLVDLGVPATEDVDVVDPWHSVTFAVPPSFELLANPTSQELSQPLSSCLLPDAEIVLTSPDESNAVVVMDNGTWRGVSFTGFVELGAGPDARQVIYNAATWASGFEAQAE